MNLTFEQQIKNLTDSLSNLLIKKNKDYGDSFGKTLEKYGDISFMVRLEDKINRLESIIKKGEINVTSESENDTLMDIAGYCLLKIIENEKQGEKFKKLDPSVLVWKDIPNPITITGEQGNNIS